MRIYDLSNVPEEILDKVGGKAKGLYLLNKFSFNVPKGFILIDVAVEQDFLDAYDYYEKSGLGEVAVRSSATIEDGENYSNAGQYETFLNVSGKDKFIKAVKDCISSLGNFRSQTYGKTFLNTDNNKMTVVVQEMVDAKCAGVMFTKNPMEKDAVLIECVAGLGESLVSGEKSAEQYNVKNGECEVMPENAILTKEQVKLFYDSALKIEKDFGMPMDVEWAIDKKGELLFLQSRPITSIEDDGVNINEFDFPVEPDMTITTCNVREMLSCAVTPLTMSTSAYCLDYGMRKLMEKDHAVKKMDDLPPFSCISPFYNSMFLNQSTNYINVYRIAGNKKETTDIVICGRILDEFPDLRANYSSNFKRALNLFFFLPFVMSGKKAKNGIEEVMSKLKFNYDDTLEGLYKQTEDNFYLLEDAFFFHYCSSYFSGASSTFANNELAKYFPDRNKQDALFSGVLTNVHGIESALIIDMMTDLARLIIEEYPDAKNYTREQLADIITNATGKIKESYDKFIEANGHRGINESELRLDCWADNLLLFCDSLKGVIATYGKDKAKAKEWTEYLDEILAVIPKKKHKAIIKKIENARSGAWHREYTKSRIMKAVWYYRKAYRKIAQMMVERNLLPDADLIYFLTKDEIGQLINGDKTFVKKAMKRRRLYPIQCSLQFEEVCYGKPVPIKQDLSVPSDATEFAGTPASPGIVTGKARIINSIEDANTLEEGEIMVAKCTDVGWTPYYCVSAGLVTEIGSALSHGVVVAREYGLPTVVNAHNIMNCVKNGDIITMDGSTGKVFIQK